MEEIFAQTGIQFMAINTLYQLMDDVDHRPEVMARAECFLNIGDYFNYLLSGVAKAEESLASTTQIYNPKTRAWSPWIIESLEFPKKIFPSIVPSGTALGPIKSELATELKWPKAQVIATCSHDTGAAVAAVPAEGEDWAFLSSGTWSLLGVEMAAPVITEKSRAYNFTNEAGLGGTTRLLKNIVGLWIVQECRRAWAQKGETYSYDDLTRLANEAEAAHRPDRSHRGNLLPARPHAGKDRRVLHAHRPDPAGNTGRHHPLRLRKSRPSLSPHARTSGGTLRP